MRIRVIEIDTAQSTDTGSADPHPMWQSFKWGVLSGLAVAVIVTLHGWPW